MHPVKYQYRNHNVHINPVFNYDAHKQASSSKMLINPAMRIPLHGLPSTSTFRSNPQDTFNEFVKQKFNELSHLMYRDSLKVTTAKQVESCTWQNQNTQFCDTNTSSDTVPFHGVFSKGWFFHKSCDTKCSQNSPFDIQSCCFINERCLPQNTLNMSDVKKTALDFYKTKTLSSNSNNLVSVSKHKLVRKSDDVKENKVPAKRKSSNALVMCTRRKLIRKSKPAELPALLTRSEKLLRSGKKNYIVKRHSIVRINSTENASKCKRKRTNSVGSSSPVIVLTKSKLIRKHLSPTEPLVSISRHKLSRRIKVPERPPEKMIAINANKLIRSSLLQKTKPERMISINANKMIRSSLLQKTKPEKLISINANKLIRSSLLQKTKPERLISINANKLIRSSLLQKTKPERLISINANKLIRSSLLQKTKPEGLISINANKLIRSSLLQKTKPERLISINANKLVRSSLLAKNDKLSRNQAFFAKSVLYHVIRHRRLSHRGSGYVLLTRNKLIKKAKTWKKKHTEIMPRDGTKMFVSLGNNKLMRKSLFAKNNQIEKKPVPSLSPIKNKLLVRMLNSPSRRIQRFTNHMTRLNLKYVNEDRSRFSLRRKNKKIIRKKRNTICPVFQRKGTCAKLLKEECYCIHDRKYVALCKNFISGTCDEKDCLLSHEFSTKKISICRRYLRDNCHLENCPYLHVKPALNAAICLQFLKGYCESGETCINWHVYACPEFKSASRCAKGDACRLPHLGLSYFEGKAQNSDDEDGSNWRYFEKNKINEKDNNSISLIPERQSLGELPDYIPI